MSEREAMLTRIKQAVQSGNRPGSATPLRERGSLGYQGGGPDPMTRFCEEFDRAGGKTHVCTSAQEALDAVLALVAGAAARRILLGESPLDKLGLSGALSQRGLDVLFVRQFTPESAREPFFAADLGISGVHHLIAETGSIVVEAGLTDPRSLSLLPPVHIAVADRSQILPDLFDLFAIQRELPSCLTLITGPSKTGDIELRLVTGVHGPGEVYVVLLNTSAPE